MAAQRTDKSNWQSKYGGGWVSFQQRLAEIMCERLANKNSERLPDKFWYGSVSPKYRRHFLLQVQLANSLLKLYSQPAIIAAINKTNWAYSLGGDFLDPLIQQEEVAIANKQKVIESQNPTTQPLANTNSKPRPTFVKGKSKLNSLRDL